MSVKLHRCSNAVGEDRKHGHPCWRVSEALDAAGVEYEIVKGA